MNEKEKGRKGEWRWCISRRNGGCLARGQSCPANRIIINYDTVREKEEKGKRQGRPPLISMMEKKGGMNREGGRKKR